MSGTGLDFVTIEGGGQDQFSSRGCITIDGGINGNTYLNIDRGRLVADGTAEAGVILGASDAGSTGGGWLGVFFRDATLSGSRLTHTLVKQGGQDAFGARGGINVIDSGPEVTLDHVTFAANSQADVFHTCSSAPTFVATTGVIANDCE